MPTGQGTGLAAPSAQPMEAIWIEASLHSQSEQSLQGDILAFTVLVQDDHRLVNGLTASKLMFTTTPPMTTE